MAGERRSNRRQEAEAWWAFLARVFGFLLGAMILTYETLTGGDRLYLIVAAIGLMGPAVASSVAQIFASMRGGSSDEQ